MSVVSVWEAAIKEHALTAIGPEPLTNDPFDRLLLGVCAVEHMKLLTLDRAMLDHPLTRR